jgi:hypothetical protein
VESEYSIAWGRARVFLSRRRRRWGAVAVGSGLLALGHVLLWAWVGDRYGFCWSECTEQRGEPPFVGSYLVLGIALWVLAPFAVARLSGRTLLGTVFSGFAALAAFATVFMVGELATPGEANSLPGLTLAVAVAGAMLLASRSRRDLLVRGVAVAFCFALSLVLVRLGIEAANWGNLAAVPALAVVGLADELAAIRRE